MSQNVRFKIGTKAQYLALSVKDPFTLYWLRDTQELFKGDELYGIGRIATQLVSGLMSAEDKAKLDSLENAPGLQPVDKTVIVDYEDGHYVVGVSVSEDEENAVEVREDGIFVPVPKAPVIPEYTLERLAAPTEGFAASYQLKLVGKDGASYVGDVINVPATDSGTVLIWEELE